MSQRIVFVMPDNSVQVMQPAPRGRREAEDPMTWFKRVAEKTRPKGSVGDAIVIDVGELPKEHRDAWVWDGSKVVVDPSRIRKPSPRQETVQPTGSGTVDLSPLYEEIANFKREVADLFASNTQAIIDHLVRYMSEINIAMNALKSDAEAADDKVRMVRESCRQILGEGWQERAQDIVAQHDADAIRLMGAS